MTTFKKPNTFPDAGHSATLDFVFSDSAALASHMSSCASGRSRFFSLHAALESGQTLLCTHTATCTLVVAVAVLGMLSMFGMA